MASAQVLPNPVALARKQGHLEAGKRRLEEFRKKKASDRAKKAASVSNLHNANVDQPGKLHLENQRVRLTDSNGAGTSDGVSDTFVEPSHVVIDDENKVIEFVQKNELGSYDTHANPPSPTNYYNAFPGETVQAPVKDREFDGDSPQPQGNNDDFNTSTGASGKQAYAIATEQSVVFRPRAIIDGYSGQPNPYGLEEAYPKDNDSHVKDFTVAIPATSHAIVANLSPENSGSFLLQNKFGYTSPQASGLTPSLYEDSIYPRTKITESSFEVGQNMHAVPHSNNAMILDMWERKLSNSAHFPSENSTPLWPSESQSAAFSFDVRSPSNPVPFYPAVAETNTRRSRPSFLDSINMPRVPLTESGKVELFNSKVHDIDVAASSASEKSFTETEIIQPSSNLMAPNVRSASEHSMTSTVSAENGEDVYRHTVNENSMDSHLRKQDENFAALEQHIEDLTQEKFSLQRALEASRALAESLAGENSSLTDSYNQQGSVVNQLKYDMEMLQEEIKAQLVDLQSLKMEYANAQLECNAADERAKLLASEVIGLEEKTLRLRSSELKMERQLENSQAEISSFKKKISSLEKERRDFHSTIDALQEEKKLLQDKLRNGSANGKFIDGRKSLSNKRDMSTSTEDLIHEDNTDTTADDSNPEMHCSSFFRGSDVLLPEDRQFNLEVSSSKIPPDQMRTIQNINTLISELALEKEEVLQTLLAESSESSKLKELNKELSQKLEAQTQRLELLTAQSMAFENVPTRVPDSDRMHDNTPYADEGDEVVERVLGWVMKLFPGGPSKRRTSKLL